MMAEGQTPEEQLAYLLQPLRYRLYDLNPLRSVVARLRASGLPEYRATAELLDRALGLLEGSAQEGGSHEAPSSGGGV